VRSPHSERGDAQFVEECRWSLSALATLESFFEALSMGISSEQEGGRERQGEGGGQQERQTFKSSILVSWEGE
jgi:hypothetical protein